MSDDEQIRKNQATIRAAGLCGELGRDGNGWRSFCALAPGHTGSHGVVPDRQEDPEDVYDLIEGLVQRVAALEAEVRRLGSPTRDLIGPGPNVGIGNFQTFDDWAKGHGYTRKP